MKRIAILGLALPGLLAIFLLPMGFAGAVQSGQWDTAQLKKAINDLGYETKELVSTPGKEKYEFTLTRGDLDIPIAAEISGSKSYVWLTVFLGPSPSAPNAKHSELLKATFKIAPCHFYVTDKGSLMCGIPIENRSMANSLLRKNIDKIADDVVSTRSIWE